MKQILSIFAIALFLMGSITLAQSVPRPIAVKIITNTVATGLDVEITDTSSGKSHIYTTNEYGELIADASDFAGYRDNDNFQVKVLVCGSQSSCVQNRILGNAVIFEFDLKGIYNPPETPKPCPSDPVDDTPYKNCDSCCPSGDCPICEVCPDKTSDWSWLLTAIIALLGTAGWVGYGFKIYKKADGTTGVLHKHKNVIGYHSTTIIHKKAPHKKGELAPKYDDVKNSFGYYDYIG